MHTVSVAKCAGFVAIFEAQIRGEEWMDRPAALYRA